MDIIFIHFKISNTGFYFADQESCVSIYPNDDGLWNDDNCGAELGWICKKPKGATAAPPETTVPPTGHCPAGWLHINGKCIYIDTTPGTFNEARERCQSTAASADLVSIHGDVMQGTNH